MPGLELHDRPAKRHACKSRGSTLPPSFPSSLFPIPHAGMKPQPACVTHTIQACFGRVGVFAFKPLHRCGAGLQARVRALREEISFLNRQETSLVAQHDEANAEQQRQRQEAIQQVGPGEGGRASTKGRHRNGRGGVALRPGAGEKRSSLDYTHPCVCVCA